MIITRAPFRVSFCGGGSDLPSFYEKYGGCVISTTIKKYMYLILHQSFQEDEIILKYSKTEVKKSFEEIEHPIFRQCLQDMNIKGVSIASMADIPAGTGLGSSSSFTVALLQLLYTYSGKYVSKYKLAKEACEVEINKLGEPIGKQDQYAAAFGGLKFYEFLPNGFVNVEPIIMTSSSIEKLQCQLMMFYLGGVHSASQILKEQVTNLNQIEKVNSQKKMCQLAITLKNELQNNNIEVMGEILHESWLLKKTMASGITSPLIDDIYSKGIAAGAKGGKLLGAGGTGFILFFVPENHKKDVREALRYLQELNFEIDNSGASIIHVD